MSVVKFVAYHERLRIPLEDVTSWDEVIPALKQKGFKKGDQVRVHKKEYHLVATTPQLVNL